MERLVFQVRELKKGVQFECPFCHQQIDVAWDEDLDLPVVSAICEHLDPEYDLETYNLNGIPQQGDNIKVGFYFYNT